VRVRRAAPEDLPALAAIAARSYGSAFRAILEEEALAARDAAFFEARLALGLEHLWVAEADGRAVAFCLMRERHIDMLFADPDRAGQGAGTALLRAVEAEGACSLECFADNAQARRFYERRGWRLDRAYSRPFLGRERRFVAYRPAPGGGH
jgi:putative acetyltransferase